MNCGRLWGKSPLFIIAIGVGLFSVAVVHHVRELLVVTESFGPLIALLVDGLPALGLGYAGYWITTMNLSPRDQWTVFLWCLAGSLFLIGIIAATLLVRIFEGRVITEPMFPLLIAAEAGAIAGMISGYYNARARTEARRAQRVGNALAFANELIRHDLRNDLTLIRGHAELLTQSAADFESSSGDPAVIAENSDEALSRIETSRVIFDTLVGDPDLEPTDLVRIVAEQAERVEDTYDVTVTTEFPDEGLVAANAGIRSVVDNLLENSVEHNNAENPRIDITVESDVDTVQLAVQDNGPGIPEEQKQEIFDADEFGGGLALIQALVDAYRGEVWVEDNEPRGSVFMVKLPRAESETGEDGPTEKRPR